MIGEKLGYKENMEHSRKAVKECREAEKIDSYLKRYYTFCMGTLYEIFSGETEYKEAARDSFERLFSLYLLKKETDLLYEKIELVAWSVVAMQEYKEQEDQMKMELAKYVAEFFDSEVLHDIFYSPGIYHRVLLVQYINDIDISADEMEEIQNIKL